MTQTTPRSSGRRIDRRIRPEEALPIEELTRYDLILWGIPALFSSGLLFGSLFGVPLWMAGAIAAAFVVPLVADALALNPPT